MLELCISNAIGQTVRKIAQTKLYSNGVWCSNILQFNERAKANFEAISVLEEILMVDQPDDKGL